MCTRYKWLTLQGRSLIALCTDGSLKLEGKHTIIIITFIFSLIEELEFNANVQDVTYLLPSSSAMQQAVFAAFL